MLQERREKLIRDPDFGHCEMTHHDRSIFNKETGLGQGKGDRLSG